MVEVAVGVTQLARAEDLLDRQLESFLEAGYRLGVILLRDRDEAQDAVQDAAALAWRKVGHVRDPSSLRAWFLAIVASQCRSRLRHRWRSVLKLDVVDRHVGFSEESVVRRLDVSTAIGRLPPDDRLALYLHYFEDLTLADSARVVGCRLAAFRSRLYRAVDRLRDELGREEDGS
jgi:RNA polymerase sigma-70 factor (ECF subfamily)